MKPNPAYFTDPKQNVIKDFFKFATQSGTSGGSVSGADLTAQPSAEGLTLWSGLPKAASREHAGATDFHPDGLPQTSSHCMRFVPTGEVQASRTLS